MSSNTASAPSTRARGLLTPKRIVALALTALTLIFILQNRQDVTMHLLGIRVAGPLWFATVAVLVVGIAIGALLVGRRST